MAPARAAQQKAREVEQFLELVVNFQNDPMAVRIISFATLSLPLPHLNSLARLSLVQLALIQLPLPQLPTPQLPLPEVVGALDCDATGRSNIRTETVKRPPSGGLFRDRQVRDRQLDH
ncbi:hypothetical protein QA635_11705 [Bradyrhizobium brasilense]|uniref:hypothetical protein n=1 Tax=Bradyrhizobium brasilense TaxID=1419277 RepID=UPI0024B1D460|nr:hypothetical protein [Bradyrhizobium australafricanum]WFU35018.1 hypothetical protein QA635_11705 [Bradyrhizobium australafricanum]